MRNLDNSLQIRDIVLWVTNRLNIDRLGLVINRLGDLIRLIDIHELGVDAQTREEDLELVVSAAVEVGGGDDVVAGVGKSGDGDELGSLAGRGSESGDTAFEGCDALLEDVDGGLGFC
jgi:hypothetical protein